MIRTQVLIPLMVHRFKPRIEGSTIPYRYQTVARPRFLLMARANSAPCHAMPGGAFSLFPPVVVPQPRTLKILVVNLVRRGGLFDKVIILGGG